MPQSDHERRIAAHFGSACHWQGEGGGIDQGLLVLGFTNRSGSNLLADYLRQTGLVHSLGENLNWNTVTNQAQQHGIDSFPAYVRHLAAAGAGRPHFGVKASWEQLSMLLRWNIPAMFTQMRVIVIQRRSIIRQAVSLAIARQTRQWSSRQAAADVTPAFDARDIEAIMASIERSNAMMLRLCDAAGLTFTTLYYEDLLRDPAAVVAARLGEIGIPCGALHLDAPAIERQSNHVNDDFVARMQARLCAELGVARLD